MKRKRLKLNPQELNNTKQSMRQYANDAMQGKEGADALRAAAVKMLTLYSQVDDNPHRERITQMLSNFKDKPNEAFFSRLNEVMRNIESNLDKALIAIADTLNDISKEKQLSNEFKNQVDPSYFFREGLTPITPSKIRRASLSDTVKRAKTKFKDSKLRSSLKASWTNSRYEKNVSLLRDLFDNARVVMLQHDGGQPVITADTAMKNAVKALLETYNKGHYADAVKDILNTVKDGEKRASSNGEAYSLEGLVKIIEDKVAESGRTVDPSGNFGRMLKAISDTVQYHADKTGYSPPQGDNFLINSINQKIEDNKAQPRASS